MSSSPRLSARVTNAARVIANRTLPWGNWGTVPEPCRAWYRRLAADALEAAGHNAALELGADAVRRYCAATLAHSNATPGRAAQEALLELECAQHDLFVVAGYPCPYCSDGDCPGLIGAPTPTMPPEVLLDVRPIETLPGL